MLTHSICLCLTDIRAAMQHGFQCGFSFFKKSLTSSASGIILQPVQISCGRVFDEVRKNAVLIFI